MPTTTTMLRNQNAKFSNKTRHIWSVAQTNRHRQPSALTHAQRALLTTRKSYTKNQKRKQQPVFWERGNTKESSRARGAEKHNGSSLQQTNYARSFLLSDPRKASPKRFPAKNLNPRDMSKFEQDMILNPYAFLTKIIQAAVKSDSEGPHRSWIVPDKIIPANSPAGKELPKRFGDGKWVFSGSALIRAMVKEGKYKMINTGAFMRPDVDLLIYAQMTYRIMVDCQRLAEFDRKSLGLLDMYIGDENDERSFECKTKFRGRLHCVLYFENNDSSASQPVSSSTSTATTGPPTPTDVGGKSTSTCSMPSLPTTLLERDQAVRDIRVTISIKDKGQKQISVPQYNMTKLIANYPDGLSNITRAFRRAQQVASEDSQRERNQWIGIYRSKDSIPLAIDLWRLGMMLPVSHKDTFK
ncbi:hypothetical protein BG004_008273 [Podila humilis]|nr:hypothetical protein BG004_008273 [Podila humilis]